MSQEIGRGHYKTRPEDFVVVEQVPHVPDDAGEHLWVRVSKKNWNTQAVAEYFARLCKCPINRVSFAGIKDRYALAEQWFSIHLPGKPDPDLSNLPEGLVLIQHSRHGQKLKRGALSGNQFTIHLRQWRGNADVMDVALQQVSKAGFPNKFGTQRFGAGGKNILQAQQWFAGGRKPKGLYLRGLLLSAARSEIFNAVLSKRIEDGSWQRILPGECCQLEGSQSWFTAEVLDTEILARYEKGDIHPTGPLWGRGGLPSQLDAAQLERRITGQYLVLVKGLETQGLKQQRRALRCLPKNLQWQWLSKDHLVLEFFLRKGSYATALLDYLGDFTDCSISARVDSR